MVESTPPHVTMKPSKKKTKKKPKQGKLVVATRDAKGNIYIGKSKQTTIMGDMAIFLFIGIFAITVFVFGVKAINVFVNKKEAAVGDASTTMVPLMDKAQVVTEPKILTNNPLSPSPTSTSKPVTKTMMSVSDLMDQKEQSINYRANQENRNRGPTKAVILPKSWKSNATEVDSIYHLGNSVTVGWDTIPITSFSVTISIRLSNPPLPEPNPDFFHKILATNPITNGLVIAMPGKNKYRISIGSEHGLIYVRPKSFWSPDHEVFQIRFIQVNPGNTRIETIFNGHESILKKNANVSISLLRSLPPQLNVYNTFKIENIWVTYSP